MSPYLCWQDTFNRLQKVIADYNFDGDPTVELNLARHFLNMAMLGWESCLKNIEAPDITY